MNNKPLTAFSPRRPALRRPPAIVVVALLLLVLREIPVMAQKKDKDPQKQENRQKGGGRGGKELDFAGLPPGNTIAGSPTDRSVQLSLYLEKGQEAFVEYGTMPGNFPSSSGKVQAGETGPVGLLLEGLKPGTAYHYRVRYRAAGAATYQETHESWFFTQRGKDQSFSFGIQGDSHPEREGKMFSPSLYRRTVDSVSALRPDFYFLMGDDFSLDRLMRQGDVNRRNVEKVYMLQRQYWGNPGINPPLFLVNGNHEQAARYLLDGSDTNAAVLAAQARNKFYPLPEPGSIYSGDKEKVPGVGMLKDYYAFEWGNALFVVIDPYWHSAVPVDNQPVEKEERARKDPWGITLGEEQYRWFKATLENSKARFKFVFAHHVSGTGRGGVERARLFEWGGYGQNGNWEFPKRRPGWDLPIHQLMVKNKVTIFFQGHDHLFARQELDGVIYQSMPNPADDTYTAFNSDAYQSGDKLPNSGFLYVTVSPTEVKVDYRRIFSGDPAALPPDATRSFQYSIK